MLVSVITSFLLEEERGTIPDNTFYTPQEWRKKGERYGRSSVLVMVHDGGPLAPYCNLDYGAYALHDRLVERLAALGYYFEPCTTWYSAIYPT